MAADAAFTFGAGVPMAATPHKNHAVEGQTSMVRKPKDEQTEEMSVIGRVSPTWLNAGWFIRYCGIVPAIIGGCMFAAYNGLAWAGPNMAKPLVDAFVTVANTNEILAKNQKDQQENAARTTAALVTISEVLTSLDGRIKNLEGRK